MKSCAVKVSVLIPCCNVEQYVGQCLDSVINQSLEDIDKTLEILKDYADKDKRLRVVDKENSGYGDTMNMGLALSKGEYIGIVESDDFVDSTMFEKLYSAAKKYDLDKCRCGYFDYYDGQNHAVVSDIVKKNVVFCPLEDQSPFWIPPAIWSSIYKRQWLSENRINFLKTPGASFQDTSFAFKTNALARRFMMIDECLIHYRQDSGTNSVSNKGKVYCVCDEFNEIYSFLRNDALMCRKLCGTTMSSLLQTYDWNFKRIDKKFRLAFLLRWWREIVLHFLRGEVGFSDLSLRQKKIFMVLLTAPWAYYLCREFKYFNDLARRVM